MGGRTNANRFWWLGFIGAVLLLGSCKAKKSVLNGAVDKTLSTRKIIQNHYSGTLDFTSLSGRVKIDYEEGDTQQGITVSLRMKKDEAIWVSAPLGLFKAYITPKRVSFYNKLEKEYFDGDFAFLSDLLGYEMDFEKVQNLLVGNVVLDMRKGKYTSAPNEMGYTLKPKEQADLFKAFFTLEPQHFRVATQQVSQPWKERVLSMEYEYQEVADKIIPSTVAIEAADGKDVRTIHLDFKGMEFGKKLGFPYKIPKGFDAIVSK